MSGGQKIIDGLHEALRYQQGAKAERAAIVAWLQERSRHIFASAGKLDGEDQLSQCHRADAYVTAAKRIARGDHLPPVNT